MGLYMENTKIATEKTVQEIGALLGSTGFVETVQVRHKGGRPEALAFSCKIHDELVHFKLPAKVDPVFAFLQKRRAPTNRARGVERDKEQAERVAWRQVLRWVQAQLALIELEMVTVSEVFLAYAMVSPEETFHDRWLTSVAKGKLFPLPK